jgi:hypothetical protein
MRMFLSILFLGVLAFCMIGCASGTKFTEFQSSIEPLTADVGRIYFYRTAVVGAAVQPDVVLNDEKVGKAVPQGFWYLDRPPGEYQVVTTTETKRTLSFTLEAGQTRYVKLDISMGVVLGQVHGVLVDKEKALEELKGCKYIFSKERSSK